MNRRGQTAFLGIIFGIMIFIAGTLFLSFISERVTDLMGTTGVDCDNSLNSDGIKGVCLISELIVPYFIIIFASIAGGLILGRLI